MKRIIDQERVSQEQVKQITAQYLPEVKYIGDLGGVENGNIREEVLKQWIVSHQEKSQETAERAIKELKKEACGCDRWENLKGAGEAVYNLLRYGTSVYGGAGKLSERVEYIDWRQPENNIYELAEEVTVRCSGGSSSTRRPDIVLYVNGIALVVLELKRSSVSVKEGIRQSYRNQQTGEIPQFFTTVQLVLAGNSSEGLYYGTTATEEKYFLRWKEMTGESMDLEGIFPLYGKEEEVEDDLLRGWLQMVTPWRLLELIHDLIIYDGGIKKICRPNQYFAIKAAQQRIYLGGESGIIWHSQGSGKSLLMVWLARWIRENIGDSRVVIITDRDELDKQITQGLRKSGQIPENYQTSDYRATSGNDLLQKLNSPTPWIITTLIHKFVPSVVRDDDAKSEWEKKIKRSPEMWMEEVSENIEQLFGGDFHPKGNLYVFVDECHRTQGGILHKAMRKIMGDDVMLIGFTGTPLLSGEEKRRISSQETFGRYIHTYRFDEAVEDGVVLDLRYEARDVPQRLGDEERMELLFETKTRGLNPSAKEKLKKRWANLRGIYSSEERIKRIVGDILFDMDTKPALAKGYGNAMLVCDSIYECFKYWTVFEQKGYGQKCAVITSYEPIAGLSNSFTGERKTEEQFKYDTCLRMLGGRQPADFEELVKKRFIEEPGEMKLLIVCDKLLTGFDAPSATYLYMDRKLVDHNLFQAICRVNRVDGEWKSYGFIIDYKKLFEFINQAIEDYTNGESTEGGYEKGEIAALMKGHLEQGKKELDEALKAEQMLLQGISPTGKQEEYFAYFCYEPDADEEERQAQVIEFGTRRDTFYDMTHRLIRRYTDLATVMEDAGYSEVESKSIHQEVQDYYNLLKAVQLRSSDYVDMARYDAEMRDLLDQYIDADRSEVLEEMNDFSFLDLIVKKEEDYMVDEKNEKALGGQEGVAETLVANSRRVINRKREQNPAEYERLSDQLKRLLKEMREGILEYKDFLRQIVEINEALRHGEKSIDPRINSDLKKALYDNLENNVDLALKVNETAVRYAAPGFEDNPNFSRSLRMRLDVALQGDKEKSEIAYRILTAHKEQIKREQDDH